MPEDFLSGVIQVDASIGDQKVKLPVIVSDSRIMVGYFPAPIKKLNKLLPDGFTPAKLLPGTGLVQLSVYEHRKSDLGPFNEFSLVIPLCSPEFKKIPFYNLFKASKTGRNYNFLRYRASDSEVFARTMGEHFLFPEFKASIEFTETEDWLTGEVKENGSLICRLRGQKMPSRGSLLSRASVHSELNRVPFIGEINFKEIAVKFRDSSIAELTSGSSHPIARELSETLKSTKPSMYIFSPSCQFVFNPPK